MSQLLNKEVSVSPSMMTFNEYYNSFVCIKESYLTKEWGCFVDIESNNESTIKIHKYYAKPSRYVSIPKTIKEYPSIRSMKSFNNLNDTSMIFEMEEDNSKHRTNNIISLIPHAFGLIGLVLCYFVIAL